MRRTYPLPDREGLGPRERAMAVYKLLLDLEPEQAVEDVRFQAVVEGFAQAAREAVPMRGCGDD